MRSLRSVRTFLTAFVVALSMTMPAWGQTTSGGLTGTVQDAQGAIIPGATVVLTSDTRGTKSNPVVTNASGDFSFPNLSPDTYTVDVTLTGFKSLKRSGVVVGAGNRVSVGVMTIQVGGASEQVEVKAEAPMIQATTGERSFTIETESVANLPIANRSFTALTSLTPGVSGNNRIGGGGGNNIMIDGVSAVDTGSNSILLQMNVESIAEVKVLTSGYQAEFGRSSGLQVTAVTKSGSNRFHGSLYDVERNSDWDSQRKTAILNGDAKAISKQRDWGYSLGGPVGKPGGSNKIFFFYSHEYAPRTQGGGTQRYRVPTLAERNGDFSQSYINTGALLAALKDPTKTGTCSATVKTACFPDNKIPSDRFYQYGQAILNQFPLPTITGTDAAGLAYNYERTLDTETATGQQPAIRVDYQPSASLRITAKYSGWRQTNKEFLGSLPQITASKQYKPVVFTDAFTANYTLNATTFIEATYGHSQNDLAGCGLAQGGTGPTFCTSGIPTAPGANRDIAGLGGLPLLFPDALKINPNYYAYTVLQAMQPAMWVNGEARKTQNFTFGGTVTNSPPNTPFSGFLNKNATDDISISVTHLRGQHSFKGGFYNTHSWKAQQQNSGATFGTFSFSSGGNNFPLDTGFTYANALLGMASSYNQQSRNIEGTYVYNNTEGFIQDNWKVSSRFTLDYGIRFVHQQPQYDKLGQASNFFMDKWDPALAPRLYEAVCPNNAATCATNVKQAKNPITGASLGVGSGVYVGTIVPNSGSDSNGLFLSGQGISKTTYTWPTMGYAPRVGGALDLRGDQKMVIRGGIGLYFDRPSGNSIYAQVLNPPSVKNVTVNNADLRTITSDPSKAVQGSPSLSVFFYDGGLPSSTQWNTGIQMTLPWSSALDVSYVGQHGWNTPQSINLNAVDFGSTFAPANQDPTQAPTVLGSNAVLPDQMRPFRGYGNINQQNPRGWSTYHSIQLSYQRRFTRGLSFGFNDTWSISSTGQTAARLQHNVDAAGHVTVSYRDDQAVADKLLQGKPTAHTLKGNFVWDLPDISADATIMRIVGAVANDWQLSGIWTATTGAWYAPGFSYNGAGGSVNLTGSADYNARIVEVPGAAKGGGCNSNNPLQQFNPAAFQGPAVGSVGLESGPDLLQGCFQSVFDLSIARNIRLGGNRNIQLRVDMFNAPNQAIITNRNTSLTLTSPSDPVTILNLPYDAAGNVIAARSLPRGAGVGVATDYQQARSIQGQVRFSF